MGARQSVSERENERAAELVNSFVRNSHFTNEFLNHLSDLSKQFDLCNVDAVLAKDDVTAIPTNTAGNSQLVFAKLLYQDLTQEREIPVAIKIFLDPMLTRDTSEYVEAMVYVKMVGAIVNKQLGCNVVGIAGYAVCSDLLTKIASRMSPDDRVIFSAGIHRLASRAGLQAPTQFVHMLALEKAVHSVTFSQWITDWQYPDDALSIFFQHLYTLELFNRFELRHNDYHGNNQFVQRTSRSKSKPTSVIELVVDGASYYVSTEYILLVYDFDRASAPWLPENTKLRVGNEFHCVTDGECTTLNPKYDTFKFLFSARAKVRRSEEANEEVVDLLERLAEHSASKELVWMQLLINMGDGRWQLRNARANLSGSDSKSVQDEIRRIHQTQTENFEKLKGTFANEAEFERFRKTEDKFRANRDFHPPDYPAPLWMRSTLDIIRTFPDFQRLRTKPADAEIFATYSLPTRQEALSYVASAKRARDVELEATFVPNVSTRRVMAKTVNQPVATDNRPYSGTQEAASGSD
jgi:hypothetical protein